MLWPSRYIVPSLGSYSLNIRFKIVVFPIPLLPTIAIKLPGFTEKLRLLNILFDSLTYLKDTSRNVIAPLTSPIYLVPSTTDPGVSITFLILLISIKLSSNERYIEPRMNKGNKNWSMSVCIIMISPVVNSPICV